MGILRAGVLVAGWLAAAPLVHAQAIQRLGPDKSPSIEVGFEPSAIAADKLLVVPLPGAREVALEIDTQRPGALGTFVQAHAPGQEAFSSYLSINGGTAFGMIHAADGAYMLSTGADGVATITDIRAAGLAQPAGRDDAVAPPPSFEAQADTQQQDTAAAVGDAIVDIGLFYTASMVDRFGLALTARFYAVIDLLNQALANSQVPMTFVIGHIGKIDYSETASSFQMVDDLNLAAANSRGDLSQTIAIRNAKGLDIVGAHRVYQASHDACGIANLNGSGRGAIGSDARSGHVVSHSAAVAFCSDLTTAHEAGHTMGLAHNRENAAQPGVFSYSYGWRVPGVFRTVMAYPSSQFEPELPYFSDPAIICNGQACGRPVGAADEANNAESLRDVASTIAALRPRAQGELFGATLPSSRAVQVGSTATVFATIINSGPGAMACGVLIEGAQPGNFSFRATNVLTGEPIASLNTPVSIPANGRQTYLLSLTATGPFSASEIPVQYFCQDRRPAIPIPAVNTLLFSASATPRPDVIALALTPTADGVLDIADATGLGAFVVGAANVGAAGRVVVTPAGQVTGVNMSICQTNAAGACLAPPEGAVMIEDWPAGEAASFAIFIHATGPVPFDPARNRVFVRFSNGFGVAGVVGATSVAVRTP